MRILMRVLALIACMGLLGAASIWAQQVPVAINTTNPLQNTSSKSIIVNATCNATNNPKDLEGWVGQGPSSLKLVASLSGTDRQAITIVVPPLWFYKISVVVPSGGSCSAWSTTY